MSKRKEAGLDMAGPGILTKWRVAARREAGDGRFADWVVVSKLGEGWVGGRGGWILPRSGMACPQPGEADGPLPRNPRARIGPGIRRLGTAGGRKEGVRA